MVDDTDAVRTDCPMSPDEQRHYMWAYSQYMYMVSLDPELVQAGPQESAAHAHAYALGLLTARRILDRRGDNPLAAPT